MKTPLLLVGLALMAFAAAQDEDGRLSKRPIKGNAAALITEGEVATNLDRLERIIRSVQGLPKGTSGRKPANPNAPAKRTAILARLEQLFELSRPNFKFTPKPIPYSAATLAFPTGHPSRAATEKLVSWGFVNRVSPLVTGKTDGLSLKDFGETMALFVARTADLTHTPSTKFSPYLMGG